MAGSSFAKIRRGLLCCRTLLPACAAWFIVTIGAHRLIPFFRPGVRSIMAQRAATTTGCRLSNRVFLPGKTNESSPIYLGLESELSFSWAGCKPRQMSPAYLPTHTADTRSLNDIANLSKNRKSREGIAMGTVVYYYGPYVSDLLHGKPNSSPAAITTPGMERFAFVK